ncbi:MAG: DUF2029 domain-containing protein [Vicinamibacterales bacterium]|nr:DUF2029 domain-containing protein [Vicinamibacterales bacterium]
MNLGAGVVIATWPQRQTDLLTVRSWGSEWLFHDANIYESYDDLPDYPPHAIIFLSPLAALPAGWAIALWAALSLALAPLAAWLAIRVARPQIALSEALLPMLMFLCWGGFRSLLQFSLLALVFGLLSMVLAKTRPNISGICLGMSLMKPQIAVPFFLWTIFTRRFRTAALALAVVAGGVLVYCFSVSYSPVAFVARYAEILRIFYSGHAMMVGRAEIRPLVMSLTTSGGLIDAVAVTAAGLLLVATCIVGFREGKSDRALMFGAPAMAAIWSLLTFYHLTYGFVLLLPVATLLIFLDQPRTSVFRTRVFWAMQLGLMFDVVTFWRWFAPALGLPAAAATAVSHADRWLMLALFVAITLLAVRGRSPESSHACRS